MAGGVVSKAKRVMQQNRRAAFVLDMSVDEFFQSRALKTLRPKGIKRILRWSGDRV